MKSPAVAGGEYMFKVYLGTPHDRHPLFKRKRNHFMLRRLLECGDMSPLSKRGYVRALQISVKSLCGAGITPQSQRSRP
jgi:hypothetical protein